MQQEPRFIKQLLDTNFDHFITRKVAKVFYIIWIVLLVGLSGISVLASLVLIATGQAQGFEVLAILAVPLASFLLLIVIRLAFETSIALVLIAENTRPSSGEQNSAFESGPKDVNSLPKLKSRSSAADAAGEDEEDLPSSPKFD
jgi:hypothetical protein